MIKVLAVCNNCEQAQELRLQPEEDEDGDWIQSVTELAPTDWYRVQYGDEDMIDLCSERCLRNWVAHMEAATA